MQDNVYDAAGQLTYQTGPAPNSALPNSGRLSTGVVYNADGQVWRSAEGKKGTQLNGINFIRASAPLESTPATRVVESFVGRERLSRGD